MNVRRPDQAKGDAQLVRSVRRSDDEELRVELAEFNGWPYISLRLWFFDRASGSWCPTRKGLSIRMKEAGEVSRAIVEAIDLADNVRNTNINNPPRRTDDRSYAPEPEPNQERGNNDGNTIIDDAPPRPRPGGLPFGDDKEG